MSGPEDAVDTILWKTHDEENGVLSMQCVVNMRIYSIDNLLDPPLKRRSIDFEVPKWVLRYPDESVERRETDILPAVCFINELGEMTFPRLSRSGRA